MSGTNADVGQAGALALAKALPNAEVSQAGVVTLGPNDPKVETSQAGVIAKTTHDPKVETSQAGVLAYVRYLTADVAQAGVLALTKNTSKANVGQAGISALVKTDNAQAEVSQTGVIAYVLYDVGVSYAEVSQAGVLAFVRYNNPPNPPTPVPPTPPVGTSTATNSVASQNMTILLNSDRDIYLDASNNLAVGTGLTALVQICQAFLEAQLREMIYQYNQGMPTFDTVFQGRNFKAYIAAGRARLMSITGVVSVNSFTVQQSGNQLLYTAVILTIYSDSLVTITNQGVAT